ncbi:MCP methyltransferase, CheR-type [Anaeromyxobacter dehalogenans 2CP-1]|uniref:protein-glutamate O-methyltransferase n=1 Tax=Anaeromyxobacter dehalogenans (strain ATCC BAA-258 / DSM 21875 / 2CP-1) TaxID=455488 RepID=B8JEV6_ANAD2|nr:protein-glutamate O-methyltransferase CheR [Anaeromyxobacter dehalogenans]ACL66252.1 MCP methyltransferase, CheR-type [Anaeromyxobacter dehalogenans 2CP-1]
MWSHGPPPPAMSEEQFRLLRELIQAHCGIAFREDHRRLLERRLAPRLEALGLRDFSAYHRHLRFDPRGGAELAEALDLLTTNETYFFREARQLRAFADEILPALASSLARERRLRILSAGCSTGEEAWTVAVLVRDSGLFAGWDVEIAACDLSRRCVAQGRAGSYGEHAFRAPESSPMRRWFHLRGGKWVVDEGLRGMVRFHRDNLVAPDALAAVPPQDAVFCRNVMIYFDLDARRRALRALHAKLRGGGWLLLGHSESLLNVTADFELVQLRADLVYRKPAGGGAP